MKKAKIFEVIGFTMIVISFIVKLFNDQGYLTSFSNRGKIYFGLIGLILWSLAYSQRKTKNKK